jgi:MoaE-MoaD fusion protein
MHFRHDQIASARSIVVRCRLFARYAELAGTTEVTLELPSPSTVADAVAFLRARIPGGPELPSRPLAAVNAMHALPDESLHDGDELALLPPLAGGVPENTRNGYRQGTGNSPPPASRLVRAPLDVTMLLALVNDPALGGTAAFLGTVRASAEDGPVTAIEYSAYEEMAEAELERIISEALHRWPGSRVEAQHRLGSIPVGEASIAIAAAAPHRAEAFEACRYVIEEVKTRLPIWKKEIFQDGSAGWRGNDGTRGPAAVA